MISKIIVVLFAFVGKRPVLSILSHSADMPIGNEVRKAIAAQLPAVAELLAGMH